MATSNDNFEKVLQKVNSYVTLKRSEREEYTKAFDATRFYIIERMREADKVFKDLYRGCSLGGSYADNLKVSKPDEFDLVLHIKIRCRHLVVIEPDEQRPGYVKINLGKVLKELSTQKNSVDVYNRLQRLVNNEQYLVQNKMQSWIESILKKVLPNHNIEIESQGKTYNIEIWTKCGPAHTLRIKGSTIGLSIDFVPSLIFNAKEFWPVSRPYPEHCKKEDWIAIPKPIKGYTGDNISFITSFPCEKYYIDNKDQLKNTLKIMKKLRNRQGIENLKSYFIKTAYLLETDKVPDNFWSKNSASYIFMYMFGRILSYVQNKNLPFFWSEDFNQFQSLSKNQLDTMYGQLKKCYDTIEKNKDTNPSVLYKLFLTEDEMTAMNSGQTINNETEQSWWRWPTSSCSLM